MPAATPNLRLEQSPEAERLNPVLSPELMKELDTRLASIHRFFKDERDQGEETLVKDLRLWTVTHRRKEDQKRIFEVAQKVRERAKAVVVVGIGGSDLGARVVHEVLDHPYYNELSEADR